MNPAVQSLRTNARQHRETAAHLLVQMDTVRRTIDQEMRRWESLRNERLSHLASSEDAELAAREVELQERFERRRSA